VSINKKAITTEEIPRMETVMKNFAIYRWVERALEPIYFAPAQFAVGGTHATCEN